MSRAGDRSTALCATQRGGVHDQIYKTVFDIVAQEVGVYSREKSTAAHEQIDSLADLADTPFDFKVALRNALNGEFNVSITTVGIDRHKDIDGISTYICYLRTIQDSIEQ